MKTCDYCRRQLADESIFYYDEDAHTYICNDCAKLAVKFLNTERRWSGKDPFFTYLRKCIEEQERAMDIADSDRTIFCFDCDRPVGIHPNFITRSGKPEYADYNPLVEATVLCDYCASIELKDGKFIRCGICGTLSYDYECIDYNGQYTRICRNCINHAVSSLLQQSNDKETQEVEQ